MDDEKRIWCSAPNGARPASSLHVTCSEKRRFACMALLGSPDGRRYRDPGPGRTTGPTRRSTPLVRPIATPSAAQAILSTIARRIDKPGHPRGRGRPADRDCRADENLESVYWTRALRRLSVLLYNRQDEGCSLQALEGGHADGASPTRRQLARRPAAESRIRKSVLALTIYLQNTDLRCVRDSAAREYRGACLHRELRSRH